MTHLKRYRQTKSVSICSCMPYSLDYRCRNYSDALEYLSRCHSNCLEFSRMDSFEINWISRIFAVCSWLLLGLTAPFSWSTLPVSINVLWNTSIEDMDGGWYPHFVRKFLYSCVYDFLSKLGQTFGFSCSVAIASNWFYWLLQSKQTEID